MPITIRDAVPADMAALQGVFERASLSNEDDRGLLSEHPEWLTLSEDGVRQGRVRVAVDASDSVVGFATYLVSDGVAELEDLFVDPPFMRRRIGGVLVLDVCALVRALGCTVLEVTANPHATDFYTHIGFVAGEIVDTEGYPAQRMRRRTG